MNIIPLVATATLLIVLMILFLIIFLITVKSKQNRKVKTLLQALVDERERTMYTISLDIHDNVSQMLNLLRMTIKMADKFSVPGQKKYLEQAGEVLDNIIFDLRNIGHSLNADYLKNQGLSEFLEQELNWVNTTKKLKCALEINDIPKAFPSEKELMIIRIAQEAIQNSIRHSQAAHLWLQLDYGTREFKMIIRDDGKGFAMKPGAMWKGLGLKSMQRRSQIINGSLSIQSAPFSGTTLVLRIARPEYLGT